MPSADVLTAMHSVLPVASAYASALGPSTGLTYGRKYERHEPEQTLAQQKPGLKPEPDHASGRSDHTNLLSHLSAIYWSYRQRIAVVERCAVDGGSRRRGTSPPAKKALLQVNVSAGYVVWLNIWVTRRNANVKKENGSL